PAGSTANAIQDVAVGPICAVAGDPSEAWLRGGYAGSSSSPVARSVITLQTDADCLSALASGTAVAAVTAWLSDADIHALADVRVIGGPDAESRSVVVHRSSPTAADPSDLLSAVDDAFVSMRTNGTLTRLSRSRFGGFDLTTTP
ncbi:MAG TPA: transporter substrate-binding domain-containing protein, partial [Kribbella sp.]